MLSIIQSQFCEPLKLFKNLKKCNISPIVGKPQPSRILKWKIFQKKEELTQFTVNFFGLCSYGGRDAKSTPTSKSPKLKMIYQWKLSHRRMYHLSPLFACFLVWFASRHGTMTSFLWIAPVSHVNLAYNSTCLQKIIWNCLHWYNICILNLSFLYLKQKSSK